MVDATTALTLFGLGAFVIAALIARLPVATCPQCPHCLAAARRDAEEQRRLRDEFERKTGIPPGLWGRSDDDNDDERRR